MQPLNNMELAAEREAAIEVLAEDGPISMRMVVDELEIPVAAAQNAIKRLVKQGILEKDGQRFIANNWHHMYRLAEKKPSQASMFCNVARDALVSALFGNENRDSEAAWVF